MVNILQSAKDAISRASVQSGAAILFYSGGKDSIVLLDLMAPHFKKIVCVFMYFVKGMRHIQPYLDHAQRYPNVELMQVPHYMLTDIYKAGVYCPPNANIRVKKLRDVDAAIRQATGIGWSFYGMRQTDGLHRMLMLRTYEDGTFCEATKKVYPLSHWKKDDVLAYIKAKRLPMPVNYGLKKASSGLSFDPVVFNWLRTNYPDDLERIYKAFPLSKIILYEYDKQVPEIRGGNNPPKSNKKRAVQSKGNQPKGKKTP